MPRFSFESSALIIDVSCVCMPTLMRLERGLAVSHRTEIYYFQMVTATAGR